jgi:hypothetical protein
MATTTNYGWTTPDDTALVKDGAAAIRTLGSSVDTTTKALNPSTTLGDIEYRSSTANTNTRLGIGSTGNVLTVAGGVPSWAAPAAGGMTLINAGGTTLTGASITISSIPATYLNLQLVIENYVPATDNAPIHMRFNSDSGTRYASEKYVYNDNETFNNTVIQICQGNDNSVSGGLSITDIFDYAATTRKMVECRAITTNSTTTTNFNFAWYYGFFNQTAAITSITLQPTGSGFTSGTAYLYGVK